jgi:diadenosine tetraphosphate (Ap4A) HIT family hydrolase
VANYDQSDVIYETDHFLLTRSARPFVSREEGGHLRIFAKRDGVQERRDFTPEEAVDFIRLSSAAGQALERGMNKRGVKVVKVNFEELGNWAHKYGTQLVFHEHIFGRVLGAPRQPYPEAIQLPDRETGFYDGFEPLNDEDLQAIKEEIEAVIATEKFADKTRWKLA